MNKSFPFWVQVMLAGIADGVGADSAPVSSHEVIPGSKINGSGGFPFIGHYVIPSLNLKSGLSKFKRFWEFGNTEIPVAA